MDESCIPGSSNVTAEPPAHEGGGVLRGQWRVTYQPGEWIVLAGPSAVVMLQPTPKASGAVITHAWELVLASRSASDLVARLAGIGLDAMPNLAVVFRDDAGLHALLRGDTGVEDAEGRPVANGSGARTWHEVDLEGERVQLVHGTSASQQPLFGLPLLVGAARADRVLVDLADDAVPAMTPGTWSSSDAGVVRASTTKPTAVAASSEGISVQAEGAALADIVPGNAAGEPREDTEAIGQEDTEALALDDLEAGDVGTEDAQEGDVQAGEVQDGAPGAAGSESPEAPRTDAVPASVPVEPAVVAAEPVASVPGESASRDVGADDSGEDRPALAELRANTGDSVLVRGQVVIGRAPAVDRFGDDAVALRVPSPGHDISRTHALVLPDGDGLHVVDLHSTNGTILATGQGEPFDLDPGVPTPLPVGSVIDLGDGITIEVLPA